MYTDQLTQLGTAIDAEINSLTSSLTSCQQQVSDLQAQLAASQPAASTALFGACPGNTGGVPAVDAKYGHVPIVRIFNPGAPKPLPVTDRDVIVSFKVGAPADVKRGTYDNAMTIWFKGLPAGQNVYWTYWHEPEDEIKAGQFTTADYIAAWAHLAGVAKASGSPANLHSTLILMAYTLDPSSGRTWTNYYAGDNVIDVLGWDFDGYANPSTGYPDFTRTLAVAPGLAAVRGKPWLVAEFAATRRSDDPAGTQRATWLTTWAHRFVCGGASTVALYDYGDGLTDVLSTPAEISAWSALVNS